MRHFEHGDPDLVPDVLRIIFVSAMFSWSFANGLWCHFALNAKSTLAADLLQGGQFDVEDQVRDMSNQTSLFFGIAPTAAPSARADDRFCQPYSTY